MAKCKKCSQPVHRSEQLCLPCRRKWMARRVLAVNQAIKELKGPLTKDNLPAVKRRVREILKEEKTNEA